jgi:hypothetical protein
MMIMEIGSESEPTSITIVRHHCAYSDEYEMEVDGTASEWMRDNYAIMDAARAAFDLYDRDPS